MGGNRHRIVVSEIPYQQIPRWRRREDRGDLVNSDRIKGISGIRDESDLKEPVRLIIELKRAEDPDVILNQFYQFSPLQTTFSIIFLGIGRWQTARADAAREMLDGIHPAPGDRDSPPHPIPAGNKAPRRKHTVEGLLLALADIDEIIQTIRESRTQPEAKERLMGIECPASMLQRALGEEGFASFILERGEADTYTLTSVQTDEILKMRLSQLVGPGTGETGRRAQ